MTDLHKNASVVIAFTKHPLLCENILPNLFKSLKNP